MPKETKKFINPLLRPSTQEVEPKQEIAPKQEKSATTAQATKTSPTHQVVEQEEKLKPADPPIQEASEPVNGSTTRPRPAKTTKHITASTTANGQENGLPERDNNHVQTYEPQAETLRAHPNQTLIRPETPPYNAHVSASTVAEGIVVRPEEKSARTTQDIDTGKDTNTDLEENDDDSYESEVDFTNVTTKARRKRGEQAFEKTHVRITVWIDKSLKQSFEDLAFQRDKPKTTLLNEAIADLVRKYEAH